MKRIGYHPHVHPALPWCVAETSLPDGTDTSRIPKVALFATKSDACAAHPDASVDAEHDWECGITIATRT